MIHVSALSSLAGVAASLATYDLLTLLSPTAEARDWSAFAHRRHRLLAFHDITVMTDGLVAPDTMTMQAILAFGREAAPDRPLLIHCWAGISRSSAAAYVIACDRNPGFEREIADELRRRSPLVTPNILMVQIADELLGRDGAMVDAITRIGRGADAFEGAPYRLPTVWPLDSSTP
jgi:predicted protein tyrosine phosphatase